jgi:hypothetical protein
VNSQAEKRHRHTHCPQHNVDIHGPFHSSSDYLGHTLKCRAISTPKMGTPISVLTWGSALGRGAAPSYPHSAGVWLPTVLTWWSSCMEKSCYPDLLWGIWNTFEVIPVRHLEYIFEGLLLLVLLFNGARDCLVSIHSATDLLFPSSVLSIYT